MSFRLARLLTATLLSASATVSAYAAAGSTLIWRGDVTTARGVVDDVAKTWEKSGHGKIELQPFNTASGIDAVAKGTADLAGSARGTTGGGNESTLTFTPVAWDALVMITHKSNPVKSLTLQQLHDIYYGKITNWKDVGGNDEPIDLYAVASPADGVEYSLRRLLFGRGTQPVAAPRLYVNTAKLEEGVALDTKGLGASTLAGIHGNPKLKALQIDGVTPTSSSVANGSYVLFTPIYLVTNASSPKAADTKQFIDFLSSASAKSVLKSHDVIPYDDGASLAALDSSRRAKILAQVGARASASEPMTAAAPALAAAAPAAKAAVATTPVKNAKTEALAARKAKAAELAAARETAKSAFSEVKTTVVSTAKPGFQGVHGEAITLASSGDDRFARVISDAWSGHGKLAALAASPSSDEKPSTVPVSTAAPAKAKLVAKAKNKPAKAAVGAKLAKARRTYKVGSGDTLYSIAKKHNVDVAQVRAWNGMKDNTVRPGQVLHIGAR